MLHTFGWDYPAGAENDPHMPWNQSDPDPVEVDVNVVHTLHRVATIETENYTGNEEDGYEFPEGLTDDYKAQCKGPLELIQKLKDLLLPEFQSLEILKSTKKLNRSNQKRYNQLKDILADCEGWEEEELDITEA